MGRTRKKQKMSTSNRVLICLGLFLFAFIVTMIAIFWEKGAVPDTLITCTLGAGGVEAFALAWIRNTKTKSGETVGEDDK